MAEQTIEKPDYSVHPGVPDEVYHEQWPGVSKSKMWRLCEMLGACFTYESLKNALKDDRPDTDELIFGRAFDDVLFYGKDVLDKYAEGPTKTRGTKAWLEAEAETPEVTLLTPDEISVLVPMVDSLLEHPISSQLLQGSGHNQVSVFWADEQTGLDCKGRIDRYTTYEGYPTHIDIKTCRDLRWFNSDALKYGYYVQAAHYMDGCKVIDRLQGNNPRNRRFMFVVVEKKAFQNSGRHRVEVFEYGDLELESSLRIRDRILKKYKRYLAGEWPGDKPHVRQLWLPESIENQFGDMED